MSRGLLSKRLDQLERDGLVERADGGYQPTPACEELRPLIFGLAEWGRGGRSASRGRTSWTRRC
jgi:DNA-binding HxlR family transcriptional regulator